MNFHEHYEIDRKTTFILQLLQYARQHLIFDLHQSKAGISTCTQVTGGLYDGKERAQADINTARDMFGFKIEFLF